jgi:hypothetical protein
MAKKQTRRSISVSRTTYERLKAFCEVNGISMSQFVESRVGDYLGDDGEAPDERPAVVPVRPVQAAPPRPAAPPLARPVAPALRPMTSAAARYAVEPPPPIIKPRVSDQQPKAPAEPTPGQIFTF